MVGLSLELAGSEDPEVQSVRQGIIGLGGLLLNVDTIFGVFMQSLFFGPMVLAITQVSTRDGTPTPRVTPR